MNEALMLVDRDEDRARITRLESIMRRLDQAEVRERAIAEILSEVGGWSRGSLIRLHDRWRRDGAAALVDRRRLRKPGPRNAWLQAFLTYTERDQRTSKNGYRAMMAAFREGTALPGVGTWRQVWAAEWDGVEAPDHCPHSWIPTGADYTSLMRAARQDPSRKFALAVTRQGMQAAHALVRPVLTTRRGLPVGAAYEFDDKWHDAETLYQGRPVPVRGLEFAGYDVASALKFVKVLRPRVTESDGRRDSLKEREFRWLHAHVLTGIGFHRDGVRLYVEHGTAAIRDALETRVKGVPEFGPLITYCRSGILSEQAHAGLWPGRGGGNFRMKPLVEGGHRIDHDAMASLPGQVGKDPSHKPESHEALVRYHADLMRAAAKLPERTRALLQLGMLTWEQYVQAYDIITDAIAWRTDHDLEGWDDRTAVEWRTSETSDDWHSLDDLLALSEHERAVTAAWLSAHPSCKRARPMSRMEVWSAGQTDLIRVPLFDMTALMMPEDARPATVGADGLIRFHDQYLGRDEQIYHAQVRTRAGYLCAVPPGRVVQLLHNPFCPQQVWLTDPESGRLMGMAPRLDRAPKYDQHAILAAAGDQNADLARKLLPIRGRHQAAAEDRAVMVGHNADVLRAAALDPQAAAAPAAPPALAPASDCSDAVDRAAAEYDPRVSVDL